MKTYEIVGDVPNLDVIVKIEGNQVDILGPYTTRDNATRRIRSEKKKDEGVHGNLKTPRASNEVAQADVSPEDRAFINSGGRLAGFINHTTGRMVTFEDVAPKAPPTYQIPRGNGYRPAHRANRFKSLR